MLFTTVGVHPTRAGEFDEHKEGAGELETHCVGSFAAMPAEKYLAALLELAVAGQKSGKVVAIGESIACCSQQPQRHARSRRRVRARLGSHAVLFQRGPTQALSEGARMRRSVLAVWSCPRLHVLCHRARSTFGWRRRRGCPCSCTTATRAASLPATCASTAPASRR
jgi:hypothetical protein